MAVQQKIVVHLKMLVIQCSCDKEQNHTTKPVHRPLKTSGSCASVQHVHILRSEGPVLLYFL